ncbi:MAG: ABC transporter permease [Thermodesulfobacteriota bacterium]
MSWKRMWAMFRARNHEFFRDRAAFGWNFLFPFLIIVGFGIVFSGRDVAGFKVGVFPAPPAVAPDTPGLPPGFAASPQLHFVGFPDREAALARLRLHKIDFVIDLASPERAYWLNDTSPKGAIVERLFWAGFVDPAQPPGQRQTISGRQIRYLDWLFPGVLGMNMMFSALWGVGYVVVRYRKNGTLKRLRTTPLTAFEFLTAQALSRLFLLMFTLVVVWIGSSLIFAFRVEGSYLVLGLVFLCGALSLTAMGLLLAARGVSEEFTSGILNFLSWPMMFLSEVWFSLEGAPAWVRTGAKIFPLTHMLAAARRVMNEGAGLWDVLPECGLLLAVTLVCLVTGALLFSWTE